MIIRKMEPVEAHIVRKVARKAFGGFEQFFVGNPKEALVAVVDDKIVEGLSLSISWQMIRK